MSIPIERVKCSIRQMNSRQFRKSFSGAYSSSDDDFRWPGGILHVLLLRARVPAANHASSLYQVE